MATDFPYYRANVSIIQVAEALGYTYNPKAGRNPVEYTHPQYGNIVISNPHDAARQMYFTRNEDANRGDVIEFVRHRLHLFAITYNNPIHGIKKILNNFTSIPFNLSEALGQWDSAGQSNVPLTTFQKEHYQISAPKDAADLAYLTRERKLTQETISLFLPHITIVQSTQHQYNFRNIGFAYQVPGEETTRGYELVNYNYKGFTPGEYKRGVGAVWLASLAPKGLQPLHVIFSESAIDAMSFFQLNRHRFDLEKIAFVSVGGTMSQQQAVHVINYYPYAKIHTAFDNDVSGKLYAIRLAAIKAGLPLTITKQQQQDVILFELPRKKFTLPTESLSLEAFKKESGLRPPVREHRSQGKDFNEMVQQRYHAQHHEQIPKARFNWGR